MSFSHNPIGVSQAAEHVDIDCKASTLYYDEDVDISHSTSTLISPEMERRDSFTMGTFNSFSPPAGMNHWSDEAYSISSGTGNATHTDQRASMPSQSNDSIFSTHNPFLQHANPVAWQSSAYDRILDSKPPTSVAAATYGFTPILGQTDTVSYSSSHVTGPTLGMAPAQNQPSSAMPPPTTSQPMSPATTMAKDHMMLAELEVNSARLAKRVSQHSPSRALSPGIAQRDGVRKKNARFDIPEGRSLHNIDELIATANKEGQEDDVRELKQQKRLLRNRQAALDSRQRKKKHTEELEKEQKNWLEDRNVYQTKVDIIQEQCNQLQMHNEQLQQANRELQAQLHRTEHEKQCQLDDHTQETMLLRTKINYLMEMQHSTVNSQQHPSSMYGAFASDFDNLTVNEWDDFMMSGVPDDEDSSIHTSEAKPTATTTVSNSGAPLVIGRSSAKETSPQHGEPVTSGSFLLMLLLYGAFIASRTSVNDTLSMPGMSDELRSESAKVVDKILKDGNAIEMPATNIIGRVSDWSDQSAIPEPSRVIPNSAPRKSVIAHKKGGISLHATSAIDCMNTDLQQSAKEAAAHAAFGLTPAQYNALTSTEHIPQQSHQTHDATSPLYSQQQAAMASSSPSVKLETDDEPVADVYKRSLLWDRIPEDVLRDFRRMVEDSNRVNGDEMNAR